MTPDGPQPLSLAMYVVHHPASDLATGLRSTLYKHYRRNPRKNLGEGGLGLEVEYRSEPTAAGSLPLPVDFARSQATAIVAMLDGDLAGDPDLRGYVARLAAEAKPLFPRATFLPVVVDAEGHELSRSADIGAWQTLDATAWPKDGFTRRLFTGLDYHLCKLLTAYLELKRMPASDPARLRDAFARKAQVLLSHSKHDAVGEPMAHNLKASLQAMSAETFFDAVDITPGVPWEDAIDDVASSHALLVILSDSYSSRTWCRKEVLSAKRAGVPIVVANCLEDVEDRGFPYIGNVPVVRMAPSDQARYPHVVGRLFDEVLRSLVWKCHTTEPVPEGTLFLPRAPELVSLAYLERELSGDLKPVTVVYPGVPLGAEEEELFGIVAPHVRLTSFLSWKAGVGS